MSLGYQAYIQLGIFPIEMKANAPGTKGENVECIQM